MTAATLLPLAVLAPLIGAGAVVAWPRAGAAAAMVSGIVMLIAAVMAAARVLDGDVVLHHAGLWGPPAGIVLRADGASSVLLALSAVVGLCISLYARVYLVPLEERRDRGARYFWPLWLLVWAALNGVFISTDLFNLYVCLELLSIPAVGLVALEGSRAAVTAAMRYLLVSLAGSLAFLMGVAVVYGGAGALAFGAVATSGMDPGAQRLALALMTAGLIAKVALVPLHFWLPPAHAVAPAPASAVLSALVVKAAFVILLRLWTEPFSSGGPGGVVVLGLLGAVAVIWGSLLALRQTRVKMIVAWSTVAQVGYLFLMLPMLKQAPEAAWTGGLMHLTAHALAKSALFLTAGSMIHALGDDGLDTLAGLGQKLPLTFATFGLAGLSLAGMPPSAGFIGKWLLLGAAMRTGQWWWALVIASGSILAVAYVLRVLRVAFLQPAARPLRRQPPRAMTTAALVLALVALLLGVWSELPVRLLAAAVPVFPR